MDLQQQYDEANAAMARGDFDAADRLFGALCAAQRGEAEALWSWAECALHRREWEQAAHLARLAIGYRPTFAVAWGTYGAALGFLGEYDAARAALEESLLLSPDSPATRWNYALNLLLNGEWGQGWAEYRWGVVTRARRLRTLAEPWDGDGWEGNERTLYVWAEQGQGDTIMFARFLSAAKERWGGRVVLECQESLLPLLIDTPGVDWAHVQRMDGGIPCEWDAHCSLMDLPGVLGVNRPEDLAAFPPVAIPQSAIRNPQSPLRVGLCWKGAKLHLVDADRSVPLSLLEPILSVPGCHFVGLVPGEAPAGMDSLLPGVTWEQTAAAIAGLDLVITVDTAVAHLAASMGKPTWILLAHPCDFRWLRDRTDTPWYPSAKLFRQEDRGEWGPVVAAVENALRNHYAVPCHCVPAYRPIDDESVRGWTPTEDLAGPCYLCGARGVLEERGMFMDGVRWRCAGHVAAPEPEREQGPTGTCDACGRGDVMRASRDGGWFCGPCYVARSCARTAPDDAFAPGPSELHPEPSEPGDEPSELSPPLQQTGMRGKCGACRQEEDTLHLREGSGWFCRACHESAIPLQQVRTC